jgi:hypothetical protein
MIRSSIASEPEIEDGRVIVRVVVLDTEVEDTGEVFVCHLRTFDDVNVDTFPRGQTPSSPGEYRAIAAEAARQFALANREQFEELFAKVPES